MSGSSTHHGNGNVSEDRWITVPARDTDWYISKDHAHFLYIGCDVGGRYVVVDGKRGKTYDAIDLNSIKFSQDFRRVAYEAKKSDGEWYVVIDGEEDSSYEGVGLGPCISPDGRRIAFKAKRSSTSYVIVVDGQQQPVTPSPYCTVKFSPDSQHVVYAAESDPYDKRNNIVLDGKLLSRSTGRYVFTNRGSLAYTALREGGVCVVFEDKEGPTYDEVAWLTCEVKGNDLAYWGRKGDHWAVVLNGVEVPLLPSHSAGFDRNADPGRQGFAVSPDGTRITYQIRKGQIHRLIVDGEEGDPYDKITIARFSPNSRRLGISRRKKWQVVCCC